MTIEETELRTSLGFMPALPSNILTVLFACPSCSWPVVVSTFTENRTRDDLRELAFELSCGHCKWTGALLGREIVECMIVNWAGHKISDRSFQ